MSGGALLLLLLAGAAAGFLGGLLGIGGGLLVVAALSFVLPDVGVPKSQVMHVAIATSMATIVMTFVSSAWAHARRGGILWSSWILLASGMVLGAILGSHLAILMPERDLRWIVALFCAVMAWRMWQGRDSAREGKERDAAPRSPWLLLIGVAIGVISALVGIGGGSMTVPLLVFLGVRPVKAVATSAMCGLVLSVASSLSYALTTNPGLAHLPPWSLGYIYLPAALLVAIASMSFAPFGVRTAHAISGATLKSIFAAFLVFIGIVIVTGG